ncbi:MAG: DNA-directed RNA polymerase specialized sigma24 family protein [Planctomycetota bacterium]|jgi:DNA-directed RNA polymerase specialized sigma24 family protein
MDLATALVENEEWILALAHGLARNESNARNWLLVAALRLLERPLGSTNNIRGCLRRVIISIAIDDKRRRLRHDEVGFAESIIVEAKHTLEKNEAHGALAAALLGLSRQQQLLIECRYRQDRSISSIAADPIYRSSSGCRRSPNTDDRNGLGIPDR